MPSEAEILSALPEDTGRRLKLYADLLRRWQGTINLVAPSTLPDLWTRHIGDSLQVRAAVPLARRWIDFGSGGGFPGLVTAVLLAGEPGALVHLVESDKRKAAFLRTVSRETGAPTEVHAERIEQFNTHFDEQVDAVSARALAPLAGLIAYAEKYLRNGAVGVFPKGEQAEAELTAAQLDLRYLIQSIPSQTRDTARLVILRHSGI